MCRVVIKHFQSGRPFCVLEWVVFADLLWGGLWRLRSVRRVLFPSCVVADNVGVTKISQSTDLTKSFSVEIQIMTLYSVDAIQKPNKPSHSQSNNIKMMHYFHLLTLYSSLSSQHNISFPAFVLPWKLGQNHLCQSDLLSQSHPKTYRDKNNSFKTIEKLFSKTVDWHKNICNKMHS